ncbi:MAG: glycosyl hydrolase 115 family protein [Lachnospiraceae bacterium]|nr:glycosyl hydrolase 115 family protein [Lachnospiraceae bacterium]
MERFYVEKERKTADILVEAESFAGVKLVAETVSEDVCMVCGIKPVIAEEVLQCTGDRVILTATVGHSLLLERLEREGKVSLEVLRGKREVYLMQLVKQPFAEKEQVKELLVIAGSDKRGTIYGMFGLSERLGVSPLIYFGDAVPEKKEEPFLELAGVCVSKEPSVRYRGFFINDEWPAFGNWCMEKFGGINAKAYRKIFELLLRLKGNYLWPAMWRSSFSEDGPGLLSAELADTLGVVMGASHHEPMCRAGAEWQRQYKDYGKDSAWSFISNAEAITKFWEDGILRNKPFENVITIGMRGENDSKLMPENATLKDNIEVIKKAIRTQHDLIRKHINPELKEVPRMLAIYKEVEDYYFGDATCEGLKDWEELSDTIFLLSDDNYGQLRALPTEKTRNHPGGYGMYYHFDYHGAPVSYEWMNCNRLTKTWEMMTQAYESGVREMWIVNVGDLKAVEYPLCYFMELAYDYETWGSSAPNKTEAFVKGWINQQFGGRLSDVRKEKIAKVLEGYTKWNAVRSPEAMREDIYHPVHFREGDRVWAEVHDIMETAEQLNHELSGEALMTYQSMIYYPAMASLNLVLMYVETAMNKELARRGCMYANVYRDRVIARILDDSRYVEEYHRVNNGKWNHCMSSAHTGFRTWDDKDWTYPTVETVVPIPGGKSVVSFRGSEEYHLGAHWQDRGPMVNDDFTRPDRSEVLVDIDSRGSVSFSYEAEFDNTWLHCEEKKGRVEVEEGGRKTLIFTVDRSKFTGREEASVTIRIAFDNGQKTYSKLLFVAEVCDASKKNCDDTYVFTERQGYCSIRAEHFSEKRDVDGKGFRTIDYLGREGAALKAFPALESYSDAGTAPYVKYSFFASRGGSYKLDLHVSARNPVVKGGRIRFAVSVNDGAAQEVCSVSEKYYTEWFDKEWANGVLNHARTVTVEIAVNEGKNDVYVYAGDPGLILEKLVLYPADKELPESYFGPEESCF